MNYHSSLISQRVLKRALRRGIASISIVVLCGCSANTQPEPSTGNPPATNKNATTTSASTIQKADAESDSKALAARVLMRPDFIGRNKICYTIAKQIPEILQQLFCHCGCDYTDQHATLLDCYTCDHTIDCWECKGEAMMAFKMHRKGASVAEIQKAVDLNWAPLNELEKDPTEALRKYWRRRLWAPGSGPTPAEKYNKDHKPIDPFTGSQDMDSKPDDKPSGGCCGGKEDAKTTK